ncbi:MAG: hypothetical protein WD767_20065 [Alphaproteobacteria bacterium]
MTLTKPDRDILAMAPGQQAGPVLTIASGAIALSENTHAVDTEGAAAGDDLDTIHAGSVPDGGLVLIHTAHDTRTVVVRHGTGNITTLHGDDITLDSSNHTVLLRRAGAGWHVISPRTTRRPAGTTELIEEKTASDDATLDFVTGIDATYDEYILTGFLQPATDDVQLGLQFSDDGGATFETGYQFFGHYGFQSGSQSTTFGSGVNQILIGNNTAAGKVGNDENEGLWFTVRIINTQNSSLNKVVRGECTYIRADGGMATGEIGAQFNTGSIINGFRLSFVSGNVASGTVRLLGVV